VGRNVQTFKRDDDVPIDAQYHWGYVDEQGAQHWVFVRKAPLSPGKCAYFQPEQT
jgi:hypothetical protein